MSDKTNTLQKLIAFVMVTIQVGIFWVVTLCNVTVGYQCFGGPYCSHLWMEDSVVNLNLHHHENLNLAW